MMAVTDSNRLATDPSLAFLTPALDPVQAQAHLNRHLDSLTPNQQQIQIQAIRVVRHKPGRRCLIEYDLTLVQGNQVIEALTVIGKARSRGLDQASYQLQTDLCRTSFSRESADGLSVPETLGIIPDWHMWFQRKVSGISATQAFQNPNRLWVASQVAQMAHKLHQGQWPTRRQHTLADELRILSDRLDRVAQSYPHWQERLARVQVACEHLGAKIPEAQATGIHRDFYPDQVLVAEDGGYPQDEALGRISGDRLYLLDFDLYCAGNPCLDIGNFLGHLTEYSLRVLADPEALSDLEAALEETFLRCCDRPRSRNHQPSRNPDSGICAFSIQAYGLLTLVRHIFISTQFPDRNAFTPALLDLCEQRLSAFGVWRSERFSRCC